jgi:hypothetical protein
MSNVAVLFADPLGTYSEFENCDIWGIDRDARMYHGNSPVIAHPPCQRWGSLAYVNYSRWGGEHNKPGNDGGCFESALNNVKRCGGVLEHPKSSRAWDAFGIERPWPNVWLGTNGGWTCEVWQSAYGHRANKSTWLFYVGDKKPAAPRWGRPIGTHQVGGADKRGKDRNKPTLSPKEAASTPKEFAEYLIALAIESGAV